LKQAALNLADELAAMPALAVKQMMGVLVNSSDSSLEQLLANERAAVNAVRDSPDSREGMRAFMEKRDPVFNQ
jgi:enoyl-CoA hydratase